MDEISNKLVPLDGYPTELRKKAIEMYEQGYKKVRIAEILHTILYVPGRQTYTMLIVR